MVQMTADDFAAVIDRAWAADTEGKVRSLAAGLLPPAVAAAVALDPELLSERRPRMSLVAMKGGGTTVLVALEGDRLEPVLSDALLPDRTLRRLPAVVRGAGWKLSTFGFLHIY